jgi:hypothetical protein
MALYGASPVGRPPKFEPKEPFMWICLKDAFFSVVQNTNKPDSEVLVRARFRGDIEKVFGADCPAMHTPTHDYPFRFFMDRKHFERVMLNETQNIDYSNFKNEADKFAKAGGDKRRAQAYHQMWTVMNAQGDPGCYAPNNVSMRFMEEYVD